MGYTKFEIIKCLNVMSENISEFYKQPCINYTGLTTDDHSLYSEVISAWILENIDLFSNIKQITRLSNYKVPGHNGFPEHPESNRKEELIAMSLKRQGTFPLIGDIIDYQTPLKNTQKDKAGKIDLLAYDGSTLRILELKEPNSKETMLRCVLEAYTYLMTVDGKKLLADFNLPDNTDIKACPFVFKGGNQWYEMQVNRPNLTSLMNIWGCKPYYITENGNLYSVEE